MDQVVINLTSFNLSSGKPSERRKINNTSGHLGADSGSVQSLRRSKFQCLLSQIRKSYLRITKAIRFGAAFESPVSSTPCYTVPAASFKWT